MAPSTTSRRSLRFATACSASFRSDREWIRARAGIPLRPEAAFAIALDGVERTIDCGEIDGRLFFNIAGFGLDARVAHQFAAGGLVRRGFRRYIELTARELFAFEPDDHTIVADGVTVREKTIVVAVANGRQYGNGALIAQAHGWTMESWMWS
jgi:diacylglycerol kinase family enzyme